MAKSGISFVNQKTAALVDELLMGRLGFELPQLVEQAGLAAALAVARVFPKREHALLLVGPGNNGADGFVCARILTLFGYPCTVVYPRVSSAPFMASLRGQCDSFAIPVLQQLPPLSEGHPNRPAFIVDSFFGFSFKPPIRAPFDSILAEVVASKLPVFSIDIPSGWDVEAGPPTAADDYGATLQPIGLISLSVPKLGVASFKGRHFLGGRFLPPALLEELAINIPAYPAEELIMEIEQSKM